MLASMLTADLLGAADTRILDHGLLAWPTYRPVYLRLSRTRGELWNYARGGFHVSVSRGQSGGCRDPADTISPMEKGNHVCKMPLSRGDLGEAWAEAAERYKAAADAAAAGEPLTELRRLLEYANATNVYEREGVPPPVDPTIVTPEPAVTEAPIVTADGTLKKRRGAGGLVFLSGVLAVGALLYGGTDWFS